MALPVTGQPTSAIATEPVASHPPPQARTMRSSSPILRAFLPVCAVASTAAAQMPNTGIEMPRRTLGFGVVYAHDSWDHYWEGTLKRTNENIGTLTTQSVTFVGEYGITDRLGVTATLPYIRTEASQGTLRGQRGVQDLSVALGYRLLTTKPARFGVLSAFVGGTAALPMSNYTPDFLPLSIGTAGRRASAGLNLNFQSPSIWFASASSAYTWCSNVKLDRSSYFTDGHLYMTNEVAMPNVLDHALSMGVARGRWRVPVTLIQRRTLGGADIRRQDMPFVSNRMDFTRLDGAVLVALTKDLSMRVGGARVLSGRNVGQSTTFSSGLHYAFPF
jgi:hypothetical protein